MCHQFAFFPSYSTTERLLRHYKGNVLKQKCRGQLGLTTQSSSLWHSWAVDISTSCLIFCISNVNAAFLLVCCLCVHKYDRCFFFVVSWRVFDHYTSSVSSPVSPSTLLVTMMFYGENCRRILTLIGDLFPPRCVLVCGKYQQIPRLGFTEPLLSIQASSLQFV